MLSISIYNQKLKSINKYLFGKEYDNDENTKLEKIKQFQNALTNFIEDHKTAVSIDDMRQFINDQKQNLSEIGVKDPEGKLLYVLILIYENNDLDSVQDFLNLISDFDIQDVKIVFHIKGRIYRCYVCSQNCTYDVFKKAVDDLLSCNYLSMQTFKNFIDQCFSQDKDKKLIKQDCFNYIFQLLKERFNEEKIKNIHYVKYLPEMIIDTFDLNMIKSADKSIFEYILNLTKNTSALGSSYTCFSDWFEVLSSFKAEFWNSSDLKDECWIAQYVRFRNMTLDFLDANSYKRNYFYLGSKLTDEDIVIGSRESYKKTVQKFIANEHVLPETRFMIMYYCRQLYGTDTEFLKEISADGFSSIDSFFSNCEKVQLKDDLADCLSVFSTNEIVCFIATRHDIDENNRWKFLAIWESIVERCKEEKSQTEIAVFFPGPKDLFDFYEKTHSQFLKTDISKLARSYIADGNYKDLCDCLKKYKDEEIASFMKDNNEPIESLFIWNTICERCKEEKSQTEIAVFFPGPKDLFDFYKKIEPEFSCENVLDAHKDDDDIVHDIVHNSPLRDKLMDCLKKHDMTSVRNMCNTLSNSSRFGDLMDCLKKYDNTKIADFIQKNDEPCESIFIWASLIKCANCDWCKNLFKGPKDIIDFYINKVPDKFKNLGEFYVFLHVGYIYQDTKLWQDYFKSILEQKNQTHIQLFLDLFDGKINLQTRNHSVEYNIGTIMKNIFNRFDDLKSFLDFYIGIYSNSDKNSLETGNNAGRDHILQLMINKCERCCNWDLTASLLDICDKKYDFFVPSLINSIISKYDLALCELSRILQFLSKKNDLDKNLKSKLLKKIDDQVESNMKLLNVKYKDEPDHECNSNAFLYPYDFQTKLKYVIEIMNSNEVLPETKKKIYDWAKDAIAEDEYKWQCVLEMYVYYIEKDKQPKNDIDLSEHSLFPIFIFSPLLNIIQQNPNNSNKNDKNNKYKYLQSYDIGGHSNLTTLKSHQGDWHLADLENSNELRNLNAQINNLNNQIDTLQNKLNKTEFKLGWILIIWLSGIGTIILLRLRYYWASSKNSLDNTKNTLSTQKQNLENTIKTNCEKKKADYENSLAQAKEEMKKWGKCEESKNYPYDKHKEYCKGLKQIINTYERGKNLNQDIDISNSGDKISPLEEQQQEKDNIII